MQFAITVRKQKEEGGAASNADENHSMDLLESARQGIFET